MRICRPWHVATATGFLLGALLLYIDSPADPALTYPEYSPRAASTDNVHSADAGSRAAPVVDPFAPVPGAEPVVPTSAELSSAPIPPGATP